ncbi:MAG: glycerophosphodiester phosphodiesterase [Gemmatimonadota bacterium]|nr:MAG: glycerophosphodiester phosphodiesterase [Gemmatimonadota bacterium]
MILLDPEARPLVGHRGASGENPENTLLAFDRALEQGADALELDVRVTADGIPVVIHDATVDRTTSGSGAVGAHTLDRLRSLDAGRGERVPLLSEVLGRYPETPLIIEIKEAAAALPTRDVLASARAEARVIVGSFVHAALRPFSPAAFARSARQRETAAFWLAARLRLGVPARSYRAFTVPERHGRLTVVDALFVRAARRRAIPVHVWTVDEPDDARRLRALGVAGIITNFPARMRSL